MLESARKPGQFYISQGGEVIANVAWGAYEINTLAPWASSTKPTTAVAFMKLVEQGLVDIDDPVSKHIAGFEQNGKAAVRIRHLLNHTGHLSGYAGPLAPKAWDNVIADIVAAPLAWERGTAPEVDTSKPPVPGQHPAYNPPGIWILGEILRLKLEQPFDRLIRERLYLPAGMHDTFNGMTDAELAAYQSQLPEGVDRVKPDLHWANPAGGTLGPVWELARFYEAMLIGRGSLGNTQLLMPETVRTMTQKQSGPLGSYCWGLGFNLNCEGITARRYGRKPSALTFGHNGASGMIAFADPEYEIVAVLIGGSSSVIDAAYTDLGL
jgi:CubicO group peptidase (beta-lactamase class C family)